MNNSDFANKVRATTGLPDLLSLLNEVKAENEIGGKEPISLGQLKAMLYFSGADKRYSEFSIKKKSGGERIISAPVPALKNIQRCLNIIIGSMFEPHSAAYGFVKGRSVVLNAKEHSGKGFVYNMDISDFFPSISYYNVRGCLERLFCSGKDAGEGENPCAENKRQLANYISILCCKSYVKENGKTKLALPQGAPTSPMLSNLVFRVIDEKIEKLSRRYNVKYTRYADDITFSSDRKSPVTEGSRFLTEVKRILAKHHFKVNEQKTRLQDNGMRQEVTGLTVNRKVNVRRRYVRELRTLLHIWQRYGYLEATRLFNEAHKCDAANGQNPKLERFIEGKLLYMKMVKGEADSAFVKLDSVYKRCHCCLIKI